MSRFFRRLLKKLGRALASLFNVGVPLKVMLILLILFTGGAVALTSSTVVRRVGGKTDYDEAMRYIEIKDIVEENFIDPVDRAKMGQSAAAAMIAGLGDKWSRYMSADEYRTYQLSSTNEYSSIGISILKDEHGGFQVTMVNSDSPAAQAGLGAGMVITEVDGEDVKELDADAVRTLIRSKLNTTFTLTVDGRSDPIRVDCTRGYVNPVSYRIERTGSGYLKIDNFEAGSGDEAISAIENMLNANVTSFVIDLRDNPGGLMSEMTKLLDYLLPKGNLYIARDKSGNEEIGSNTVLGADAECFKILVDHSHIGDCRFMEKHRCSGIFCQSNECPIRQVIIICPFAIKHVIMLISALFDMFPDMVRASRLSDHVLPP